MLSKAALSQKEFLFSFFPFFFYNTSTYVFSISTKASSTDKGTSDPMQSLNHTSTYSCSEKIDWINPHSHLRSDLLPCFKDQITSCRDTCLSEYKKKVFIHMI